jgi:hypothetical protein
MKQYFICVSSTLIFSTFAVMRATYMINLRKRERKRQSPASFMCTISFYLASVKTDRDYFSEKVERTSDDL